jgi:hypothetical protein
MGTANGFRAFSVPFCSPTLVGCSFGGCSFESEFLNLLSIGDQESFPRLTESILARNSMVELIPPEESMPIGKRPAPLLLFGSTSPPLTYCTVTYTERRKTQKNAWMDGTPEPVFVILLRGPGIGSQPGRPVRQPYLSYRPARLHGLVESIPGLHKRLQIREICEKGRGAKKDDRKLRRATSLHAFNKIKKTLYQKLQ